MSNRLSSTNTILKPAWLPIEVVTVIIDFFVAQFEVLVSVDSNSTSLHPSSTRELLLLRLVCKTWSQAVVPFGFHTIHFNTPRSVKSILENCKELLGDRDVSCPVKRLDFNNLMLYWEASRELSYWEIMHPNFSPILMDEAAEVIEFLGENLVEIQFSFANSMGFSPEMVKSLTSLKGLKKLAISREGDTPSRSNTDYESLSDLLNATSELEYLEMYFTHLDVLELQPRALPKLRYLWFLYAETNIEAISHLCESTKENLKILDYFSYHNDIEINMAIEPVKETLEGLFTWDIPYHLPASIAGMKLPQLRVMRGRTVSENNLLWLQWPLFQTVRTLVFDFGPGKGIWERMLKRIGRNHLPKPPTLKHVIFTSWDEIKVDDSLVIAFKFHGIECHFLPEPILEEILELDYKLNGPME